MIRRFDEFPCKDKRYVTRHGVYAIIKKERNIILISEFNKIVNNQIKNQPALFVYEKIGIKTLKSFKINKDIRKALKKMSDINEEILSKNIFPLTFGGEHSITPGCIMPFVKKYKKFSEIQRQHDWL